MAWSDGVACQLQNITQDVAQKEFVDAVSEAVQPAAKRLERIPDGVVRYNVCASQFNYDMHNYYLAATPEEMSAAKAQMAEMQRWNNEMWDRYHPTGWSLVA